jgi:hypothetical protein
LFGEELKENLKKYKYIIQLNQLAGSIIPISTGDLPAWSPAISFIKS